MSLLKCTYFRWPVARFCWCARLFSCSESKWSIFSAGRWLSRVQISRRASPKVKAVYSTRAIVEKREKGSRGREKKKNVSEGCGRCEEEGLVSSTCCVVWERTAEEDQDFRVAKVIEGSHYRIHRCIAAIFRAIDDLPKAD